MERILLMKRDDDIRALVVLLQTAYYLVWALFFSLFFLGSWLGSSMWVVFSPGGLIINKIRIHDRNSVIDTIGETRGGVLLK